MELIKELKKKKEEDFSRLPENFVLEEVNQLLLGVATKEDEVKNLLGMQNNEFDKKLKTDYVRNKKQEKIYDTEGFIGSQIKELCDEYDLRCLQLSKYKGTYPPEMLRKIAEFSEKHNVEVNNMDWFILAPTETFEIQKFTPKPVDPIILYRTDGSNSRWQASEDDSFVQVYNWGNDFMYHRKINFMFQTYTDNREDWSNMATTIVYSLFMIIGMLGTVLGKSMIPIILSSILFLVSACLNKNYSVKHSQWNTNKV